MVRPVGFALLVAPLLVALSSRTPPPVGVQEIPVAQEFDRLHFRSIGPATMSGRISDLAVYEANPSIYYVATAHGGVWKTTNNGTTFTPLFQHEGLMSIGDVTVSQTNPDLVWVGTGESNNRQSTSWGNGVWKSTDGGKTWQFMGLGNSKHINRIAIDPVNNDVVLVAATGPLFGPGGDRGIYKTTDGGRTWRQVLKGDDDTGANDLVMAWSDPKILFASTYQRRRTACCMNGGGPGSGIWKSTDGGDTWTRLTGNGLPEGPLGRIAVDVFRKSANIVYALIEGPAVGGRGGGGEAPPGAADTAGGGRGGAGQAAAAGVSGLYRSDDGGATWRRVNPTNPRPMYFSQVRIDPETPDRVYLGGVGLHLTVDGGRTIETDAAMSTHDDVHAIWINPANPDHILIGNDGGLAVSYDRSKTWVFLPNLPVGLFYHVSYDMEIPYNVCGGMQDNYNWCGPSASRHNRGIFNHDWFQVLGGDGFVTLVDQRDSRIIYTESQDGNIIRRNKVTGESKSIRPTPQNVTPQPREGETFRFHWDTPMIFSPHDPGVLLVAANRVFKSTDRGDSWTVISPDLTTGANRDTIAVMGVKGSEISIARHDGIAAWPAIVALAESPRQPGVYYTGTDDGVVSVSTDGGRSWRNITANIPSFPAGAYVSEVVPSRYAAGRVYVTVDNHRANDYGTYIWVSEDFGATFRSLNGNLAGENVRTLTEDQRNQDVLYIGTETGIFVTLDRGRTWRRLKGRNFPTVRVDEITLHPRDNAMLVATHGRSLWILDHLEPIQEYTAVQASNSDAKLFSIPTALQWKQKDHLNDEFWGQQYFLGENPPVDAVINFFLKRPVPDLRVRISDASGRQVRELVVPASKNQPGIQTVCWDQRVEPIQVADSLLGGGAARGRGAGAAAFGGGRGQAVPGVPAPLPEPGYMPHNPCTEGAPGGRGGGGGFAGFAGGGNAGPHVVPGTYTVALVSQGRVLDSRPLKIVMDPEVQLSSAQRARYNEIVTGLHELQRRGTASAVALTSLYQQVAAVANRVKESSSVPANVKQEFERLQSALDSVRVKFGVPLGGLAAAGRGGGRGGAGDPRNVLARVAALKGQIMAIWEMPSDAVMRQVSAVQGELPRAIAEANAVLARARTVARGLTGHGIQINVPSER
jgi:photosystem II stability/assembly factor-like uncharacterized protein